MGPKAAQINYNDFEVSVTDGYGTDIQSGKIFINNPPSIISTPKPVGLTGIHGDINLQLKI